MERGGAEETSGSDTRAVSLSQARARGHHRPQARGRKPLRTRSARALVPLVSFTSSPPVGALVGALWMLEVAPLIRHP